MQLNIWKNERVVKRLPNFWDMITIIILFSVFLALIYVAKQMNSPYKLGEQLNISLLPSYLPIYIMRTIFRIMVALFLSLIFTFCIGAFAAKNKRAEKILIPIIDILQSVPILGFLSITIVVFIKIFPNTLMGPEFAAIFAIFTSQAWNMTLGFYQNIKSLPLSIREAASIFHLSKWKNFWSIEVPSALPNLIWNIMISMSASWFMIVTSEAININNQSILLPGIGSYIYTAILLESKVSVLYAIIAMIIVIILYNRIIFGPLLNWSEKFKIESTPNIEVRKGYFSVVELLKKTRFLNYVVGMGIKIFDRFVNFKIKRSSNNHKKEKGNSNFFKLFNFKIGKKYKIFFIISIKIILFFISIFLLSSLIIFIAKDVSIYEVLCVCIYGSITAAKIIMILIICSFIWIPIGVWIGMNAKATFYLKEIIQIAAAFPANLLFPVAVILIISNNLNVEIWTTPLLAIGGQWYILFNVISGTALLPKDLIQVGQNLGVKKWLWWKRIVLPGIFPYIVTGLITASGGAWNVSIVAEYVSWGNTTLSATGIGSYFTKSTINGDFSRIILSLCVMCLYILFFNKILWRPLYRFIENRYDNE